MGEFMLLKKKPIKFNSDGVLKGCLGIFEMVNPQKTLIGFSDRINICLSNSVLALSKDLFYPISTFSF